MKDSKVDKKKTLRESLRKLKSIKESLKKFKEEDEVEAGEVVDAESNAIDKVEDVIVDVINAVGATDPVVDTLINSVSDLEAQKDIEQIMADVVESYNMTEAEDDDADVEDEKEDEKIEESCKKGSKKK